MIVSFDTDKFFRDLFRTFPHKAYHQQCRYLLERIELGGDQRNRVKCLACLVSVDLPVPSQIDWEAAWKSYNTGHYVQMMPSCSPKG